MKKGFYIRLAADNIRKNSKLYVPYLITCVMSVVMFYVMMSLSLDPSIVKMLGGGTLRIIMRMGACIVALFAVIFLLYSDGFLMKKRQREFGVFNILGMEKRHLSKVLFLETIMTAAGSVILGVLFGMLFSKIMFLMICKMLGQKDVFGFYISGRVILVSAVLFFGIHLLIYLKSRRRIRISQPIELLRGSNVGEKEPKSKWLLALSGALCLAVGYYLALSAKGTVESLKLFFSAVILVIIATYLLFIAGSIVVLKLLRKNRKFYYKPEHFISISGMLYRMKQNAAGLASICILSTMVLVMLSSTGSLMIGMREVVQVRHPNDFGIYMNADDEDGNQKLIGQMETYCTEHHIAMEHKNQYQYFVTIGCLSDNQMTVDPEGYDYLNDNGRLRVMLVLPLSDYCNISGKNVKLSDQEMLLEMSRNTYSYPDMQLFGKMYHVAGQPDGFKGNGQVSANIIDSCTVVLTDQAFEAVYQDVKEACGGSLEMEQYYGFDTSADKSTQLQLNEHMQQAAAELGMDGGTVESRERSKSDIMSIYGGLFMLGVFLGTMFVMAMVLIIYYKQISEGYEDRKQFEIMQKVGMSQAEVKKVIRSQILMVFFLPLIMAGIHMAVAFPMIRQLLKGLNMLNSTLYRNCTFGVYLGFAVVYILIYSLTAKAYYRIVKR